MQTVDDLILNAVPQRGAHLISHVAAIADVERALGPEGFGSVSLNYIPARNLTRAEKVHRGGRIYVWRRLLALREGGRIHYCAKEWRLGKSCDICRPSL